MSFFFDLSTWSFNPATIITLAAIFGAYLYRMRQIAAHEQPQTVQPGHTWYFGAGITTILIALLSPIDALSEQLFTMHMIQHLLLALIAPPLLLLGIPSPLIDPFIDWQPKIKHLVRQITTGTAAFFIFNITLVVWHIPFFYELTLSSEPVHNLEHATFFWTGLLSWWPILNPSRALPRLSYPGQILYIFVLATPGAILGAWLVFTTRVLYPSYAAIPSVWGMTTLEDQQLGGLIMMVPGKFVYFIALTIVFFLWFNPPKQPVSGRTNA